MKLYVVFVLLLIAYCIIHSLLADNFLMKKVYYSWWYRLFYVFQSIFLLVPIFIIYNKLPKINFFYPDNVLKYLLYIPSILGIYIGYLGTKVYDNADFLGLKQLYQYLKNRKKYFFENESKLKQEGILKVIRHPYYLAGILILWGRPLYYKDLITNIVLTLYFIIGAINEERKLIKIYGDAYRKYRAKVPMIFPKILN